MTPTREEFATMKDGELAAAYGVHIRTIQRWKPSKRSGWHRNKLNLEKAKEIRALYATRNYSQKQLAARYGVCQTVVSRVVRNVVYQDWRFGLTGSSDFEVGYVHVAA
jgi:transposase